MVGLKNDRQWIYSLIDDERLYQDDKWNINGRPKSDEETSIGEWLIYMEKVLNKAKEAVYNLDEWEAMNDVRKLTALGVACMEYNKTPSRELKPIL